MNIHVTPELSDHMNKTGRHVIIVEVAKSDSSDFEVAELHPHLVSEKAAEGFIKRRGFRPVAIPEGRVLFPNYKLVYDADVTFSLKRFLFFRMVKCEGIHL